MVAHSTTKFLGGHGTSIGGIIVDGGNLRLRQWSLPELHRAWTHPITAWCMHSLAEAGLPPFAVKARVHVLRDIGVPARRLTAW